MIEEKNWAELYRPKKIEDVILPESIKNSFRGFVEQKYIPNLILSGKAGTGKTTIAKATINEIGAECFEVNGSLQNGVDVLRYDISNFASSMSLFSEGRKYVLVNEADWLSTNVQAGLRAFTEDYSSTCGFIFTCNYKNRIFKELHSRFANIDFEASREEQPQLALQFFKRVSNILENENVKFDRKVVAGVVQKLYPDFRKTLVELQSYYTKVGEIDIGILSNWNNNSLKELFTILKEKRFDDMRQWVSNNATKDFVSMYREIYEYALNSVTSSSLPSFIVLLSNYSYKHAFVADVEVNMVAFLTEVMFDCEYK